MKPVLSLPSEATDFDDGSMTTEGSVIIGAIFGFLLLIFIPLIQFGVISHIWDEYNYDVDKRNCRCYCWDTVFKGVYDRGPGEYKHVYFNATSNSLKIWVATLIFVLLLYETCKRTFRLFWTKSVRLTMFVLLACSVYPHYYSYWSYFNYWNDEFYEQFSHQLYFTITELISTAAVIYLLDKNVPIDTKVVLVIVNIGILHVLASGFDQFFENVIQRNGKIHQVLRDIFFMIPDLLHISFSIYELYKYGRRKRYREKLISKSELMGSLIFISGAWVLSRML